MLNTNYDNNTTIELHDELNPSIWENNKLRQDVKTKVIKIVNEFKDFIDIPINVIDIQLVGSNCNYNYTKYSDLDIHIIINFDELSNNVDLMQTLFNAEKTNFNKDYDIIINGVNCEIYVEDVRSSAVSNGVYSVLQDCWITFPKKLNDVVIPNFNNLLTQYNVIVNNVLEDDNATAEDVNDIINKLYMLRKNGLAQNGEFSKGNLVFKEIRNLGLLDKLKDKLLKLKSDDLSLS